MDEAAGCRNVEVREGVAEDLDRTLTAVRAGLSSRREQVLRERRTRFRPGP